MFGVIEKRSFINLKKVKITNVMPKNNDIFATEQAAKYDCKYINNIVNMLQHLTILELSGSTELFGYYLYSKKVFPEGREQFSLSFDTINMLVFGGISTKSFNDTWIFEPNKIEWKKINYDTSSPNPRFGHTSTLFQNKLVLFGGKTKQNNYSFNADIEILNIG